MVGLIGLCWIVEDTGLGFSFYLRYSPTRELVLSLLGWREKRRFVSPLSESPLGQPLAPGSDQDRGLAMRLSFSTNDPVIPSPQRKQGDGIIQLKGKKGNEWTVHYRYLESCYH